MCNKKSRRKFIFAAVAVCGIPFPAAHAGSVWNVPGLSVDGPSLVTMIEGADRNSNVKVKVRIDNPKKPGLDFGFVSGGLYTPITGKSRVRGSYSFAGESVVDFAPLNRRPDKILGTADDQAYRVSDGAGRQYNFSPLVSSESDYPKIMPGDFQKLRLGRGPDHDDGNNDLERWIEVKRSRCDGIVPVAAPVPVPSTMWLFGTGLLALAGALKRGKGTNI